MKYVVYVLSLILLITALSSNAYADSYREVRLLIDADQSFITNAGGTTQATAAINELVAKADAIYRTQLGLTITIAGIHLWSTTDPYDRTTQSTLLSSFAAYGESTLRTQYTYDAAHLLVGSGLGGEGGIAYPGSACGDISSAPYAYSLSQPDLTDQYEFNPHLLSHELGHNLNAEHDAYPACAKKTIMCVGQIGGQFSTDSYTAISSYVTSRLGAGCFATVTKANPVTGVKLSLSTLKSTVKYKVTGAGLCTSLTIVGSTSVAGLSTMFGYLQIGALTPAATVNASSKNVTALRGSSKIYLGAYCDGQLVNSVVQFKANKLKARKVTTSAVLVLRSMQRGFRR